MAPINLNRRIEILITAGADHITVDRITALWHDHSGPIEDFDFSETTQVEVHEDVFNRLPTEPGR